MATRNICTYPMQSSLEKNANAIIEQDGKLRRVNLDWEFDKKANAIVSEAEGEVIAVSDSSVARPKNILLFGKSKQENTKGYQLLDFSEITMDSGGTTVAKILNNGQTVKITGTKAYAMGYIDVDVSAMAGKVVYFSGKLSGGNKPSYTIRLIKADGTKTYLQLAEIQAGYIIEEDVATIQIQLIANNTATALDTAVTAVFENAMLSFTENAPWEKYTGGYATPSPNWAQEIVSVESPKISVYGGNLADTTLFTAGANQTIDVSKDGYTVTAVGGNDKTYTSSSVELPVEMLRGKTIVFKADSITNTLDSSGKGGNVQLNISTPGGTVYKAISEKNLKITVDIPEDATAIYLSVYTNNSNTLFGTPNTTTVCGICVSFEDMNWEAHKDPSTILLSYTIPGLPISTGGNYADIDGQEIIGDEIDLEAGVHRHWTEKKTVTMDMFLGSKTGDANYNEFIFVFADYDSGPYISRSVPALCNKFSRGIYGHNVFTLATVADSGWDGKARAVFYVDKTIGTIDKFMEYIGNDCEILYALKEPIETPLSDAEIYAFKHADMKYPNTTIINDAGAFMKLVYFSDSLRYVLKHGNGGGFSTVSKFTMNLPKNGWKTASDNTYHYQEVRVSGATKDSKIDLQPTPMQLISLMNNGTSMFAANEDGTITVYVIGSKPNTDMTIQATKMEVVYV